MFGESPRARLVEALLRLREMPFTRSELAQEAGLYRASANRVIQELVSDGLLEIAVAGKQPLYHSKPGSPELEVLAYVSSVLELMEANRDNREAAQTIVGVAKSELSKIVDSNVRTWSSFTNAPLVALS
jgi:hypothetical protein